MKTNVGLLLVSFVLVHGVARAELVRQQIPVGEKFQAALDLRKQSDEILAAQNTGRGFIKFNQPLSFDLKQELTSNGLNSFEKTLVAPKDNAGNTTQCKISAKSSASRLKIGASVDANSQKPKLWKIRNGGTASHAALDAGTVQFSLFKEYGSGEQSNFDGNVVELACSTLGSDGLPNKSVKPSFDGVLAALKTVSADFVIAHSEKFKAKSEFLNFINRHTWNLEMIPSGETSGQR